MGECGEMVRPTQLWRSGGSMATAVLASAGEPLGIVIRDGGEVLRPPRILMWLWANEEEATNEEEWRER